MFTWLANFRWFFFLLLNWIYFPCDSLHSLLFNSGKYQTVHHICEIRASIMRRNDIKTSISIDIQFWIDQGSKQKFNFWNESIALSQSKQRQNLFLWQNRHLLNSKGFIIMVTLATEIEYFIVRSTNWKLDFKQN